MVTHYEPARLRRTNGQPTAITGVQVATSASTYRTGNITLGTPTSSARSRQGRWALYPNGAEVVVVHPGGALAGAPADVAGELRRLGDGQDELGRSAARVIAGFLTDPDAYDRPTWPATWSRAWSSPASGYQISGSANQHGDSSHQPSSWPGAPARLPQPLAASPSGAPHRRAQPDPSPAPAPQRAA
jgi:hypothetical protein